LQIIPDIFQRWISRKSLSVFCTKLEHPAKLK